MNITSDEFDEFVLLFFGMCAPNKQYLSTVWDDVVKVKKAMLPETLIVEKLIEDSGITGKFKI